MSDADQVKPLYAVWLTQDEAIRILQIAEEQQILRGLVPKLKASANTKGPQDRVATWIRESEEPRPAPIQLNNPEGRPANEVLCKGM